MQLQVSSEIGTGFVNTSLGITKLAWNSKEHPRDFYDQHEVYKALYSLQCRERVWVTTVCAGSLQTVC